MGVITKKGLIVQESILNVLKEESPLSTRQLALKLSISWHTAQQHCLHLLVKKKIEHLELAGSYVWLSKKNIDTLSKNIEQQVNQLVDTEINSEFQQAIDALLRQLKEKVGANPLSPEQNVFDTNPKKKTRENRTTAQFAAGGVEHDE